MVPLTFAFHVRSQASDFIKIITGILAGSINQQVVFFINHMVAVVFGEFHVRGELNGVGWTGLLTEPTKNAARKINPKPFRITTLIARAFGGLEGNTIHRTDHRTEVTAHTAFFAIRVP